MLDDIISNNEIVSENVRRTKPLSRFLRSNPKIEHNNKFYEVLFVKLSPVCVLCEVFV